MSDELRCASHILLKPVRSGKKVSSLFQSDRPSRQTAQKYPQNFCKILRTSIFTICRKPLIFIQKYGKIVPLDVR